MTETDNVIFTAMTHNPAALHLDEEYGKSTEFGQRIVNSLFTLGLMIGISVHETTLGTTVANLGMTDVTFPKPVFHGDTLHVETTVLEIRESKSRPTQGIVLFEHKAINQRGEVVAQCKRNALMHKEAQVMTRKRLILLIATAFLFAFAFLGLFPRIAALSLASLWQSYTVGFRASAIGWHTLGAIGGAAAVAGIWTLSSALRKFA